jgi:UDP-N-acetylglucosamine 2-epimerase (non-hydrolysing)/GDP/UDP-N,N'-diacetylbacillosamine 2-epimerase (hydrolysing)
MRKICVITGTRAEYGLLSRLMKLIQNDDTTELQIVVTNMHLSAEYGNTYKEIENDGFVINKKVPMDTSSDTANAIVKSMGQAQIGFADAFEDLHPDLIIILGDRYEMLAAASAALLFKIPIAHLYGGEVTEGAYDDSIRHAITKMSFLHFTSTEEYKKRVIQLGENPKNVVCVGSLGVENCKKITLMQKSDLEKNLNFELNNQTILVTYHPVTLENNTAESQITDLLSTLEELKNIRILFTFPNSDTGGKIIIEKIKSFVETHKDRSIAIPSLGMLKYLSTLQYVGAVVGNSSSGIVEVPSFGIPTLNIGDRQKGRTCATSILNCKSNKQSIEKGLELVLSKEMVETSKTTSNPYEKDDTATQIFSVISTCSLENSIQKSFYNI